MKVSTHKLTQAEATFLTHVSHDLKSLTRAVLGASQALSTKLNDDATTTVNQDIRKYVQLIGCASRNLMPIIDDLVTMGKLQSDSSAINPRAVYNMLHEMECVRDTFSYEALAKEIELSLSISENIGVVYCDILSLRTHVLNNILSNAIRHTPVGGKIKIHVSQSDAQSLVIKITDSGLGIPGTERESLFRRYLKSEAVATPTGTKRGVGLHNALCCVKAHQGLLSIVDEPSIAGATFRIEIPLYNACIQ